MHPTHDFVNELRLRILWVIQVMMQEKEYILFAVVNWELTAIEVVQGSSFGCQQQTHYHGDHEHVQLLVLVYGSH